jgi:predicted esterase
MNKKTLIFLLAGFFSFSQVPGLPATESFTDYQEMRRRIGELYQGERFVEAAGILAAHLDVFPDHIQANTYNLALMRTRSEHFEEAVEALLLGIEKGVWYGKYDFNADLWDPLRDRPDFKRFLDGNAQRMREATENTSAEMEVMLPDGFDQKRTYPLFIALHGGGENIEVFRPRWTSPLLERDFIVAYLQSSQRISMTGFNWTEDLEISKDEIREAFEKILSRYPVDRELILIGGFSSGGVASLESVLSGIVPVRGFVVLCPAKPDGFTAERVREAGRKGIRGTLITTEMDPRLEQQREMDAVMKAEGLSCEFIVTPNIGHWYPEDMPDKLDAAVARIVKKDIK